MTDESLIVIYKIFFAFSYAKFPNKYRENIYILS